MLFVVFRSFLFSAFCSTRRELFYVFGQSPSDACTARFETSEVTEFAFSRAAPGWVTSVAAPALQRERKSMRAQESVSGYEKNQLLFTTLQAASGNSADTGRMCTHLPRQRESEWAEESAQASQLNNSCRERERELTTAWERMPLLSSAYRLHNSISFYLSTYSGNQNTKRTTKKETETAARERG